MEKVYYREEVNKLNGFPICVVENIYEIIDILNENYGGDRNIKADLGGYVVIANNMEDVEVIKKEQLNGIVAEYTDIIECSEGVNWTSLLFLLSSDYSIIVVTTEELSKYLFE